MLPKNERHCECLENKEMLDRVVQKNKYVGKIFSKVPRALISSKLLENFTKDHNDLILQGKIVNKGFSLEIS
jgi:hypothetical protein